ncbi:MAG: NUDIX domain-containing protein [Candidatus Pacebacteria bacterium]|nr:NUDIX domain-containing protein [Candidatus Paceibacterota bacterium]MBP9772580.1 NUDIX domain-containing protein [Candidatus Paceibacterota bacterium]
MPRRNLEILKKVHNIARTKKPDSYPERFFVPEDKGCWAIDWPEYDPPYFVHDSVLKKSMAGEIEAEDAYKNINQRFSKVIHRIAHDIEGRPLNPCGRTGIRGRGLLYQWGANRAVDIVMVTVHPRTGLLCFLAIKRADNGMNAVVGGMVDKGESKVTAALRELGEEVPQFKNFDQRLVKRMYRKYSDDYRNTDNSWIETTVFFAFLPKDKFIDTFYGLDKSEVESVSWIPVSEGLALHAGHERYVYDAARYFIERNHGPIEVIRQCKFILNI